MSVKNKFSQNNMSEISDLKKKWKELQNDDFNDDKEMANKFLDTLTQKSIEKFPIKIINLFKYALKLTKNGDTDEDFFELIFESLDIFSKNIKDKIENNCDDSCEQLMLISDDFFEKKMKKFTKKNKKDFIGNIEKLLVFYLDIDEEYFDIFDQINNDNDDDDLFKLLMMTDRIAKMSRLFVIFFKASLNKV